MRQGTRPTPADIRKSLDRVLSSSVFSRSERLRDFLSYVVTREMAGEGPQLKGYAIAIDVFGRSDDFNADTDPLVRVHAGKLRKLLDRYYDEEAGDETWRISLPRGAYVPCYTPLTQATICAEEDAPAPVAANPLPPTPLSDWRPRPMSSPMALLSFVLPLALFAPLSTPALSLDGARNTQFAARLSHGLADPAQALPFVSIAETWPSGGVERRFADAIRAAAVNYRVQVYPTTGTIQPPYGTVRDMRFSIRIRTLNVGGDLAVDLVHDPSHDIVDTRVISADAIDTSADLTFESTTLAASWLKVTGMLFSYAEKAGLSSPLMLCMTKTSIYHAKLTRDAYAAARSCQRALRGRASDDAPLVTNLNLLTPP
ncbi:hypothetical protein SAMN05880582_1011014 [Rhizobium sp. RU20A]|uniref:hypothetical protein n=1 Tax=Rhizobium sp. RU20A TaxID=1907412 RepID=UPI0009549772|nr:hypothetical protein [Rhizobium sp. RU20A]SIQ17836.1 hypothetical protein SAMN05880582_1011014 [Rhizobium sp. RU20A]